MPPTAVCFACIKNAGRSQMAGAFLNALVDPADAVACSAGSAPADEVHPEVVVAMREVGIDVAGRTPTKLTAELLTTNGVTLVFTMGCGDKCPYVPGVEVVDWKIPDPHGQSVDAVREIRDTIRGRVLDLAAERGWRLRAGAETMHMAPAAAAAAAGN